MLCAHQYLDLICAAQRGCEHAFCFTSIWWLIIHHSAPVAAGFEKPSAIQQKGIVPFGKGLDVIQQAQSGTGKTATFCAGVLQSLDFNLLECQALILAPTRELAQQIEKVMRALGDYLQVRNSPTAAAAGQHIPLADKSLNLLMRLVVWAPSL